MVAGATVAFAFVPVLAALVMAAGVDPAWLVAERFLPAAVFMLPIAWAARHEFGECVRGLGVGLVMAFGMLGFFHALTVVPIAHATVIYYSYPVFVLFWRWVFFRERTTTTEEAAASLILAAALLVANPDGLSADGFWAMMLSFGAPASFGLSILYISRPVRPISPYARLGWVGLGIVIVMGGYALVTTGGAGWAPTTADGWAYWSVLILGAAFVPQLFYTHGAPLAGPSTTAIAGGLELPVAAIAGAVIMGDPLDWRVWAAIPLVLVALRFSLKDTQSDIR